MKTKIKHALKIVKLLFRALWKRITCKHEYEHKYTAIGTNRETLKEFHKEIGYQCVHCFKRVDLKLFNEGEKSGWD